jgi:intracellular sulfur oxidation DsrE/DsrF family protein
MRKLMFALLLILVSSTHAADGDSPWGGGLALETTYTAQKVVYDVSVNSVKKVESVLDRASYLYKLTGADPFDSSIVLVLHGPEIDFFAIKNYGKYKDLMNRAQSLTVGGGITIKMCKIAAAGHGYQPSDIHGFIELVPMGDAEIVRLQTEGGHAYMR